VGGHLIGLWGFVRSPFVVLPRASVTERKDTNVALVTLQELLDSGVHFGHQTRRWNPKMRRFILGERNGIYLIDLRKTLAGIESSYGYVRELVANGGTILFVGTKKQTQGPVADYAQACGMPFVNQRWLGGMLTNFTTVAGRVKRMSELRSMQRAGDFENMPKREALRHSRELEKLDRNLSGIANLERVPDAIFVIDTKKEHIAVTEARKLGLPVVASWTPIATPTSSTTSSRATTTRSAPEHCYAA